jgi:hypothetical protein
VADKILCENWVANTGPLTKEAVNLMRRAAKGGDAALGKSAAKYAGVFAEEIGSLHGYYRNDLPPRRYNSGGD